MWSLSGRVHGLGGLCPAQDPEGLPAGTPGGLACWSCCCSPAGPRGKPLPRTRSCGPGQASGHGEGSLVGWPDLLSSLWLKPAQLGASPFLGSQGPSPLARGHSGSTCLLSDLLGSKVWPCGSCCLVNGVAHLAGLIMCLWLSTLPETGQAARGPGKALASGHQQRALSTRT